MTMSYNKPEVVVLASAVNAIQGQHKQGGQLDSEITEPTLCAYEADE